MAVTLLVLVGAMAFGVLSMALGFWMAVTLWYTLRRNVWRTTSGIVTDSRVASNRRANGLPGHHYVVRYEFTIQNQEYRAGRVRFGDFRYLSRDRAEGTVASYPPGSAVTVYYNAAFVPTPVDEADVTQPVTTLQPGFNAECLYPIAATLVASMLTLYCVAVLIDRLRG